MRPPARTGTRGRIPGRRVVSSVIEAVITNSPHIEKTDDAHA
jgi:hypothetical protein